MQKPMDEYRVNIIYDSTKISLVKRFSITLGDKFKPRVLPGDLFSQSIKTSPAHCLERGFR